MTNDQSILEIRNLPSPELLRQTEALVREEREIGYKYPGEDLLFQFITEKRYFAEEGSTADFIRLQSEGGTKTDRGGLRHSKKIPISRDSASRSAK
jgi:hypothetical protein